MLTEELKTNATLDEEAESICRWAAARAGVIVIVPVIGSISLMANEIYLLIRLAKLYDVKLSESAMFSFVGGITGTIVGQTMATMIPFPPLQVPIAVSVTYAIGKVGGMWIKDGMPQDMSRYIESFDEIKKLAKSRVGEFLENPLKNTPLGDESKTFDLHKK